MMVVVYVFFVVNVFVCFYYGFILLGMFFGMLFFVYMIIVVEEFGLKCFVMFYNCFNIFSFVGNYILFGFVVGKFYDVEVRK